MSNYLAIDTSSHYLTVLAKKGKATALRYSEDCAMKHSVVLMGEVEKAMEEVGLKPEECDFFAAVTGPGSFTGIRIGISTAKGFSVGTGKKMLAITSFNLLAYNVLEQNFYVVIDAAHAHYYVCGYSEGKIIHQPSYMSEQQVKALNAHLYGFENLPFENYTKLCTGDCLERAVESSKQNLSFTLNALYVRKSQAEEGRK